MTTLLCLLAFAVLVGGAWPVAGAWQRRHSGRIYEGLTPGLAPPAGAEQPTRPITERELLATTYGVQFHPPEGVQPRDVGLLLERRTDPKDLAASIIALVVRGYLVLRRDEENGAQTKDWLVTVERAPRGARPEDGQTECLWLLDYFESPDGQPVRLSAVKPSLREAFGYLEQQVMSTAYERNYITVDPRGRNAPTNGLRLGAVMCLVIAGLLFVAGSPLAWVALGGTGALAITAGRVRGPMGRPAEGTAAYFRTMGFRQYLATAEANQLKVEDAAGIFSRYLPWAIAFGVADHWTGVFRDVAAGVDEEITALWAPDLLWLALMTDLAMDGALFAGLGEALGDLGEGIGDLGEGVFDGAFGDEGMFDGDGFGGDGGDGGFFGGGGDGGFFGGGDDGGGFDFDL